MRKCHTLSVMRYREVLAESLRAGELPSVEFKNPGNHVDNECLLIGFMTKQTIQRLLNEGDISTQQYSLFFRAVKAFLVRATEYLLKWCPLEDELLTHSTWLDFENRLEKSFLSVQYFVLHYLDIFPDMNMDQLNEQFLNYQLLLAGDIPTVVKDKVAEVVMTIPHSNAGEERIFSLINKNKTPSRSSLKLNGTLSSIITLKTHIENPLQWEPTSSLIQKAKKATKSYNDKHKSS